MRRYLNQWFDVEFEGRARCIDIEFDGGFGPVFLMRTGSGKTFWVSRKGING